MCSGAKRPRQESAAMARPTAAQVPTAVSMSPQNDTFKNDDEVTGERVSGTGRLISSGTALHGVDTIFTKELQAGDAVEIVSISMSSGSWIASLENICVACYVTVLHFP